MAAERLAHIEVHANVVEEKVSLKYPMMLDHPMVGLRNEWLEDYCRNVSMIVSAQRVADVMQKCTNHILLVSDIPIGSRRCLQRMGGNGLNL